jgi:hypothetical protein
MNLFSGLNNLTDITLDDRYATICGYTQMDSEQLLNTFDVGNIPIESLMFQTGYLTIKKTGTIFNQVIHTLSYPNFEVKNAFNQYLIGYFADSKEKRNTARFERDQIFIF